MIINKFPYIMIKCLLCTIIIEEIVAIVIGVRDKKDILNIMLVNIVTNPIVTSIPVLINFLYGVKLRNIVLVIFEIITLIFEGFVYKKVLKFNKINPFIISMVLNFSSYLLGEIINYM